MSQYLILIYDGASYEHSTAEQRRMITDGHVAFGTKYGAAILGGNALQPASTATTVTPDGEGSFAVTDGPYAETKEGLGGYYLVDAADLDEAIAMAQAIPLIGGSVEIRPIMPIEN